MLLHNCSDHFFASLKDSQRQFPRGALLFCFTAWIFITFTTLGWKEKDPNEPGSSLWQSAAKPGGTEQQRGSRGDLETKGLLWEQQDFLGSKGCLALVCQPYRSIREGGNGGGGGGKG